MSSEKIHEAARKLKELMEKPKYQTDEFATNGIVKILQSLSSVSVTMDILKETKIGVILKKLTKHEDKKVSGYSGTIVKKFKDSVGLGDNKPKSAPPSPKRMKSHSQSEDKTNGKYNLEAAKAKLRSNYADEKDKKSSRTLQVLTSTPVKGKKVVKSRKSTFSMISSRPQSNFKPSLVKPSPPRKIQNGQKVRSRSVGSNLPKDDLERHLRRQEILRKKAMEKQKLNGSTQVGMNSSSRKNTSVRDPPKDERKNFLDKKFPRIRGDSESQKGSKTNSKRSNALAKEPSNNERDVINWFKKMDADMSQYAPLFIEEGFDSMKTLRTMEEKDVKEMVPKRGHYRYIMQALNELRGNRKQNAVSYDSRKRPRSAGNYRDLDEYESDDGFIVNEGSERVNRKAIRKIFRRGGSPDRYYDGNDSSDMEASYQEMRDEEERSAEIAHKEDTDENNRLVLLAKKKAARKKRGF